MIKELLLCTNGSVSSKAALRLGVHFARALHLPVTVLGIIESSARNKDVTEDMERTTAQLRKAGLEVQSRLLIGDAQGIIPAEAN